MQVGASIPVASPVPGLVSDPSLPNNSPLFQKAVPDSHPGFQKQINDLTSIAQKLANYDPRNPLPPGFMQHLRAMAKSDPTFNSRLNAEVHRITQAESAKQNSSPLAIGEQALYGAANPLEWVKGAASGAKQVGHAATQAVHGDLTGAAKNAGLGALGVAGVLPFAKPLGVLGKAVRTADEASSHVLEAAAAAKAEGFGQTIASKAKTVLVNPGDVTPETGGELGARFREGIKGAGQARSEQAGLYSAERSKRFGQAAAAMQQHEGVASYQAAIAKLKGELPKVNFAGFRQLDEETLTAMLNHIKDHPAILTGEKITAQKSLLKAVSDGKVPTAGEQKILEKVFGREATRQVAHAASFFGSHKELALNILNIPRAVMSSTDLSAPLRQGLVSVAAHPGTALKNLVPMVKSFGSERVFQATMNDIYDRPTFALMQKAKLALTDIGADSHGAVGLAGREEKFQSNLAERLNLREIGFLKRLGKFGTGPGDVIRASDRAYVGFLNKMRADVFDSLIHSAAVEGRDLNEPGLLQDIAKFVNSATGRGDLPALKNHAVTINALFFSPRLLYSRLNFLNPHWYFKLDPFARKQALAGAFNLVGTMSLILKLAQLGGAKVNMDPTNADFAKIRIGNTRIDLAGGFQQPVRLAFELAEGKVTSSTTGKVMDLAGGIGKTSRGDAALRFAFGKLSPIPSFAVQAAGVSQASFGPKQSLWSQVRQRMIPLLIQDANDLRTQPGAFGGAPSLGKAFAGYGAGLLGVGLQTYGPQPKKPPASQQNPFLSGGSSGSAKNPFLGSPSGSSSSNPFLSGG